MLAQEISADPQSPRNTKNKIYFLRGSQPLCYGDTCPFQNLVFQFPMPESRHSNQVNSYNYLDDYYETGFDYYGEADYFSTPPKSIFERILSNIPTLSERQAGIFPILLGPIFTGIFTLVAFSGKNLQQDFIMCYSQSVFIILHQYL